MKIAYLTSLGVNIGDEFIRHGILAVMDRLGISHSTFYLDKLDPNSVVQGIYDEPQTVSNKLRDCDVVVQAGAPVYWRFYDGASSSLTSAWHHWFWEKGIFDQTSNSPLFLNLGAGSCQPWGDSGDSFCEDASCADFARRAAQRASLTTVRDSLASSMLNRLGIVHEFLPCPAFLAAAKFAPSPKSSLLGVNLMPLGSHYDLTRSFDIPLWQTRCLKLVSLLRANGPLCFIAHNSEEALFMERFTVGSERVILCSSWRDYLGLFSQLGGLVSNRVHGAVCAAGFGVPSLILGNDTRALIGEPLELPLRHSSNFEPEEVTETFSALLKKQTNEKERLLDLREKTLRQYSDLLQPLLVPLAEKPTKAAYYLDHKRFMPELKLARVSELETHSFSDWMQSLNHFAQEHNLRQFTNWSKIWEYPWLWKNALGRIDWKEKYLVDLGSEISPLPWFIAQLGGKVTLIETDRQWEPLWIQLRKKLGVDVQWEFVDSEKIPLPSASADVVTSFSVVEHQPDKKAAVDEIVRILKPGGMLAISFDICEPEKGMTFPEWNGKALTMREFEALIWCHPSFANERAPVWNIESIDEFLAWHKKSAPHHNYVVGAAVLKKRSD